VTVWVFPGDIHNIATQIGSSIMPDNKVWTNRFTIESETSERTYVVAQRRTDGEWGCGCWGWRKYRHCKHVDDLMSRLRRFGYYQEGGDNELSAPAVQPQVERPRTHLMSGLLDLSAK
jgi:hypothetical protein